MYPCIMDEQQVRVYAVALEADHTNIYRIAEVTRST